MSSETSFTDRFTAQYGALKASLPGAASSWLSALREQGQAAFASKGLPTPKTEAWKYTNLNALAKLAFEPAPPISNGVTAASLPRLLPVESTRHRLVFVNGRVRPDLSMLNALPVGVSLTGLATLLETEPRALEGHLGRFGAFDDQPLLALNTALLADGFVLRLAAGAVLEEPISLVFIGAPGSDPTAHHPRGVILAEAGSRATILEQHVGIGTGSYFVNGVTEIVLGDGASLQHYKLEDEGLQAFHLWSTHAQLGRDAQYESFVLATGGKLARNEIQVTLGGGGARSRLNGAYIGHGRQHIDNTTMVDHAVPQTTSREIYKGVLDDYARGVFQGRILVRPDAQKTDGQQMSRALLLSEGAEVDAKPQLEIYADDVKCSHGAAAGELDEDALFYLRSRGIPEPDARHLLVDAFLSDVVDEIASETVRESFRRLVAERLAPKPSE